MDALDLSDLFHTKAEARDFIARLDQVIDQIFSNDFNVEEALLEQFGTEIKNKLVTLISSSNISLEKAQDLRSFFEKIREQALNLPTVTIIMAFEPKDQTLKTLSEWCSINLKKQLLFDVQIDRSLVAGASISFQGKHFERSIRTKVDEIIEGMTDKPNQTKADNLPAPDHSSVESVSLGQ